jgi:O-antigen ligase
MRHFFNITPAFLLLLLAACLPFTRELKGINLLLLSLLFGGYLLVAKRIRTIPPSLLLFSIFAIVYAALSTIRIFPPAWTIRYELTAIPQQALFAYAMPVTFAVMVLYFQKFLVTASSRAVLANQMFAIWIAWKIIGFLDAPLGSWFLDLFAVTAMGNSSSLIIASVSLYLLDVSNNLKKYAVLLTFLILSSLSPFSQNLIYALIFILIWLFPKKAYFITYSFITGSVLIYIIYINDPFALYFIDNNLTVRLIILRDAVAGFVQSNFIGVGFGTESVTNDYAHLGIDHFQSDDDPGFIHLAAHNSFGSIAFRLGIFGFLIFIYFLIKTLRKISNSVEPRQKAMKCSLFLAFFVVTFTNPALESYIYLYGVCVYLSLIWAMSPGLKTGTFRPLARRHELWVDTLTQ